jgi:RNA polymerase sigma-54 factor
VVVTEGEDGFEVMPNTGTIPRLRVNSYFEEILRKRSLDKKVKDFVGDKVQRAKNFIHYVEQRESTLVRVTSAIVSKQREFFTRGPLHLRPMTLKDIAGMLDLHESTVSRITTSKYVQTDFGVFRLKYFFSNSLPSDGESQVSSTSIKELIRGIIQHEGAKKHLSDQKIADLLKERGIHIARRTVAKYRKDLHILPSNLRR